MSIVQPSRINTAHTSINTTGSDKATISFLWLAMSYLIAGLTFGVIGGLQYVLPDFLKEVLNFQKSRPLHVYLVIAWIFTAAQGGMYYYLPRIARRKLFWERGAWIHFFLQAFTSSAVVIAFFLGYFGGREYLEFPPWLGVIIGASLVPFTVNFFVTLKPDYRRAPVYYFSWTVGIVFFYITLAESYLWLIDYFNANPVRDVTVQWKALGSMVGAWNMLIYGTTVYVMEKLNNNRRASRSPLVFFFFFLGFTNLMFNWGHHTYIVPAAPWIKTTSYLISMTELLILGQVIWKFRKTLSEAQKNYHSVPYRLFSFADGWIFLNLVVAIAISVPSLNFYTHGTHITVAHAMGATIGINTMLLFASVFYILQNRKPQALARRKKMIGIGIGVTNISLIFFWIALLGSGLVKISSGLGNKPFAEMMKASEPYFRMFLTSGIFIMLGLGIMIYGAIKVILEKETSSGNWLSAVMSGKILPSPSRQDKTIIS